MFTSFEPNNNPHDAITFADNSQGKILGFGKIAISAEHLISNVYLVETLTYNLLSASQLCDMGYNCMFTNEDVTVFRRSDNSLAFKGVRKGKLFLVDFSKEKAQLDACLMAKTDLGWLWHCRLAHVGMRNLDKHLKGEHILGVTNVSFEKNRICSACQARKQVGVPHRPNNITTITRPLEFLHMDLVGPVAYMSIGGNKYGFVIVDDFSHFTWVFFLHDKSEARRTFKKFVKRAQSIFDMRVKKVRSDNGSEFKNTNLEEYLDEKVFHMSSWCLTHLNKMA